MRLRSTDDRFRQVVFNEIGITIIAGVSKQEHMSDEGTTYNGVGKSLIIELIHFCLASDKNREIASKIDECDFILEFKIGNSLHYVQRNTKKQDEIIVDSQQYTINSARNVLESLVVQNEPPKRLSFRSILSAFIRRNKLYYNSPDRFPNDTDYIHLLRNFYLLGLDYSLIVSKMQLRAKEVEINDKLNQFKNDASIREFYTNGKDPEVRIVSLRDKIKDLEADLARFRVAENYSELQAEANALAANINSLRNRLQVSKYNLTNIQKSLKCV